MLTCRWGGPTDADLAVEIWAESNTSRRGGVPAPESHLDRVRGSLHDPSSRICIAEFDGLPVGFLRWSEAWVSEDDHTLVPGLAHIGMVFVRPTNWREGIGRLLVRTGLANIRTEGFARAQLWTHADNVRARELYHSEGFRRTGLEKADDVGDLIIQFARPVP